MSRLVGEFRRLHNVAPFVRPGSHYGSKPCYGLTVATPSDSVVCKVKSWLSQMKIPKSPHTTSLLPESLPSRFLCCCDSPPTSSGHLVPRLFTCLRWRRIFAFVIRPDAPHWVCFVSRQSALQARKCTRLYDRKIDRYAEISCLHFVSVCFGRFTTGSAESDGDAPGEADYFRFRPSNCDTGLGRHKSWRDV